MARHLGILLLCLAGAPLFAVELVPVVLATGRPTQFSFSSLEVRYKRRTIRREVRAGTLDGYLREHPAEIILGAGGEQWIFDGHHLGHALLAENVASMYGKVKHDWHDLDEQEIERRMVERGYFWLFDEQGRPRALSSLPRRLGDQRDDWSRGVAWLVREAGGYEEKSKRFQENEWARYLRPLVDAPVDTYESWEEAYLQGLRFAPKVGASDLTGYTGKEAGCIDAIKILRRLRSLWDRSDE